LQGEAVALSDSRVVTHGRGPFCAKINDFSVVDPADIRDNALVRLRLPLSVDFGIAEPSTRGLSCTQAGDTARRGHQDPDRRCSRASLTREAHLFIQVYMAFLQF